MLVKSCLGGYNKEMDTLPKKALEFFKSEGSRGGKIGSANLTPEQRKERAKKAITARWKNRKKTV